MERKIVENTDLLPTILEGVGLPVPERLQGRSFLKLARGKDDAWKDRCYSQLATAMLRTLEWKFIGGRVRSRKPEILCDIVWFVTCPQARHQFSRKE